MHHSIEVKCDKNKSFMATCDCLVPALDQHIIAEVFLLLHSGLLPASMLVDSSRENPLPLGTLACFSLALLLLPPLILGCIHIPGHVCLNFSAHYATCYHTSLHPSEWPLPSHHIQSLLLACWCLSVNLWISYPRCAGPRHILGRKTCLGGRTYGRRRGK